MKNQWFYGYYIKKWFLLNIFFWCLEMYQVLARLFLPQMMSTLGAHQISWRIKLGGWPQFWALCNHLTKWKWLTGEDQINSKKRLPLLILGQFFVSVGLINGKFDFSGYFFQLFDQLKKMISKKISWLIFSIIGEIF